MDFSIPDELTALRQSFGTFLDREIRPLEEEHGRQFWEEAPDREVLAPVDHDDEVVRAEREGRRATAHAGAQHDGDRAAHAAIPVMPRAESMAGASALRSDS